MIRIAATAALCALISFPALAGTIESACLRSDRPAANREVCGCIQDAANITLSTKDQKLAASFFRNPDRAQEIRQSDRRKYEKFWKRYQAFGETAEVFCAR